MIDNNKEAFDSFALLQNKYTFNPNLYQKEFNQQGEKILAIVREYENRLCANTERGIYSKYSANLAEKFQNEVRQHYPMIDRIGLIVDETETSTKNFGFTIKKISLLKEIRPPSK